jgi:hypothetical protein
MTNDISRVDFCYCSFALQEKAPLSIPQKIEIHQTACELYLKDKEEKQKNIYDQVLRLQRAIEKFENDTIYKNPEMEVVV